MIEHPTLTANGRPWPRSRNPGLDTLRATAIVLVFMYHYMCFVSGRPTFGWASRVGWVGVDLFFVLSGYLIANQLFAGIARGRRLSVPRFYARRAARTLPVFWLVLAAFFLFPSALGGHAPPPLWRFLTFTQNLGLQAGTAFSHAWSLCVEEQFYAVLPLVLGAGAWLAHRGARPRDTSARGRPAWWTPTRVHGWILMAALVALGVTARIVRWRAYGQEPQGAAHDYMTWVYYATLCRFDEFIPGIAVAMLKNFHRPVWDRLTAHGGRVFALGALATAAMLAVACRDDYIDGVGYAFFMTAFGFSLLALAFSVLVVAALSPARTPLAWRVPGAASLALWSYSIYLSHRPLANVLAHLLEPFALPDPALAAIIALACVALGGVLYRVVEAPFMAWRDRWVPSNFRDDATAFPAAFPPATPTETAVAHATPIATPTATATATATMAAAHALGGDPIGS